MRRATARQNRPARLTVELLERRMLLSGSNLLPMPHARAAVVPPHERRVRAPFTVRVTTDQRVYQVGQAVTMTLVATNITRRDVPDPNGQCIPVDFWVTRRGQEVWRLSRGPQICASSNGPPLPPLHSGQSVRFTIAWDGVFNEAPAGSGSSRLEAFQVHGSVVNPLVVNGPGAAVSAPRPVRIRGFFPNS